VRLRLGRGAIARRPSTPRLVDDEASATDLHKKKNRKQEKDEKTTDLGARVRVTNGDGDGTGLACATGARRRRRRGPQKGKTGLRRTASDGGREMGRWTHMFIDRTEEKE
jgi:hypothetical protein